jgi:8-oxo-dGTP pyrophosphatase MutT (NUDIX family)
MPHIHEKIDFTVEVFVVHKNKVLLRKHDKYHIWLSVGGHIELDEDPIQAAIREVKEEVGLDIELFGDTDTLDANRDEYQELLPPQFLNRHRINENHEHITLVYFATSKTDQITEMAEHEKSEDCRWLTSAELDELTDISESIKHYAKTALATLAKQA